MPPTIAQVNTQCKKKGCGSWYRKVYGEKFYCNICGLPDSAAQVNNKVIENDIWESRIREKAKREEVSNPTNSETTPEAVQLDLFS